MKDHTKVVSFRLSASAHSRLSKEARLQEDPLSPNEFARELVLSRHQNEGDQNSLAMEVACLKDEVQELRKDLAVAIRALLVTKGGQSVVTPEQADQWVKKNLKHVA